MIEHINKAKKGESTLQRLVRVLRYGAQHARDMDGNVGLQFAPDDAEKVADAIDGLTDRLMQQRAILADVPGMLADYADLIRVGVPEVKRKAAAISAALAKDNEAAADYFFNLGFARGENMKLRALLDGLPTVLEQYGAIVRGQEIQLGDGYKEWLFERAGEIRAALAGSEEKTE